ncbi:MAG: ribosome silencing factor [Christensenellales bacterium]|jgi:ribosome-associated protein
MTIIEKNDFICNQLSEKKARDIISIAVEHLTILADYFIICSAKNVTHSKALAKHIEDTLEEKGVFLKHKEGVREGRWIVLDYNEIIVHIFLNDTREMYSLEKLWSDGANITKY